MNFLVVGDIILKMPIMTSVDNKLLDIFPHLPG